MRAYSIAACFLFCLALLLESKQVSNDADNLALHAAPRISSYQQLTS